MGPVVKFAEKGTGREGFVPERGISHARAGMLLGEMARWHGYGLLESTSAARWTSGGAHASAAPVNLTVNLLDSDGKRVRSVLIRNALSAGVPASVIQAAYPG
jgi:hypothetical protein